MFDNNTPLGFDAVTEENDDVEIIILMIFPTKGALPQTR